MRGFTRLLLILGVLLLGAVAFACSSDDGDNGDSDPGPTNTEQPADDDDPNASDGDSDGDDPADISGDLNALAAQFGITEVKIEYEMASTGSGDDFSGTMTLYSKPPDSWRMDLNTPDGSVTVISTAGGSYMCAEDGGAGTCFESPASQAIPIPFLSIFTDPSAFSSQIDSAFGDVDVDRSSREIAGQSASCFTASGTVDGESGRGEYCFRDDGVLLLLRASGSGFEEDGEFSLTAIDVSDDGSDSDFDPIYDILDIGNIVP